jgi:DNA primase
MSDLLELPEVNLIDEELLVITANKLLVEAGDNLTKRGEAINHICQSLFELNDQVQEEVYICDLSKKYKISKQLFRDKLKAIRKSSKSFDIEIEEVELPEDIDQKLARKMGFFSHRGKYFFITKDGLFRSSNFIIRPLYHIYSKIDNKRLIELENEFGFKRIVEVPSKNFVSIEQFQQTVFSEGNYIFFGTKIHFMKILEHIANEFPVCNELRTLGWQREGFYAFANGIYNGIWQKVDKYGITEYKKSKYFSPAFSCVYADVREDDDEYENDRYFIWQDSPVTFGEWTKLLQEVYGEKAIIAIAFLIASSFRDLIYEKYKIFPHLFLFGEKQSGKSQLAWSLSNMFFNNLPAFNLNSGTQVGFFRRLSRVKNAIVWFDEYTNDTDEKRFQSLKSAYDGMGHEKGKMSKDNRTEITKVNSSCIISGQYLPTRDDNALFTRSILLSFVKKTYLREEMEAYDKLKKLELKGLSSLVGEIISKRELIDTSFGMVFSEIMENMKAELIEENKAFDERLVRNFSCILAPVKILLNSTDPLEVNFTFEQIYDLSKKMISELSVQISSSEALSAFWQMVEFLLEQKMIQEGSDFKISSVMDLDCITKSEQREHLQFVNPKSVLFIRFSKVHPLYMTAHRQQTGKNGVDMVSLMHYIKHHHAYIGYKNSHRFKDGITSCYCFDYDILGKQVNLDRIPEGSDNIENPNKNIESETILPF